MHPLFRWYARFFDGLDLDVVSFWAPDHASAQAQATDYAADYRVSCQGVDEAPDAVMVDGKPELIGALDGDTAARLLAEALTCNATRAA